MKKVLLLMFLTGIFFTSCHHLDDAPIVIPNCDKNAVVDEIKYNETSIDNYSIDNVVLNDNCLEITITSSGCNPDDWTVNLVASEVIIETLPVLWNTKIELINNEDCLAMYQKTVSFDVTPLQISGANQIQISVDGWSNPISYQY